MDDTRLDANQGVEQDCGKDDERGPEELWFACTDEQREKIWRDAGDSIIEAAEGGLWDARHGSSAAAVSADLRRGMAIRAAWLKFRDRASESLAVAGKIGEEAAGDEYEPR